MDEETIIRLKVNEDNEEIKNRRFILVIRKDLNLSRFELDTSGFITVNYVKSAEGQPNTKNSFEQFRSDGTKGIKSIYII